METGVPNSIFTSNLVIMVTLTMTMDTSNICRNLSSVPRVIKPPHSLDVSVSMPTLFLAGTIDMDQGERWQEKVETGLIECPVILLNPRRDSYDASAPQSIDNPYFKGQVEWELNYLERASKILMYFSPGSRSPISLLELGLFARTGKVLVCCPEGFWRKGNVDVICERFNIPQVPTLEAAIASLKQEFIPRQAAN